MAESVTIPTIIANNALAVVGNGLQHVADGAEAIRDAISPPPPDLSNEDVIDGVYHSSVSRLIQDLKQQIKVGAPVQLSLQSAAAIVDALTVSEFDGGVDDRLLLLEHVLEFLSRLPQGTVTAKILHDKVISLLWYDLPHPPASLIGRKYQYRAADGSGTSLWNPEMGRAGSAYARSVQTVHPLPANKLPSPELLFDTLLKREEQVDHPAGLSSLFFAFANLIIHSLFSTDHSTTEPINQTSSYLDLSPVYGNSQQEQDSIRLHDGTGQVYPDTFADSRLLRMPPSSPALLVVFSRNHNYIAKRLLEINERGLWTIPPPTDDARKKLQDNDIFQTARLINCGWFKSMIFGDYLFSALYHFHSSISAKDEKWAEQMFRSPQLFGDKPWDDITIQDYEDKIRQLAAMKPQPPNTWTFGGMKRDSTGRFPDAELAKILQDATNEPASAFKARGTPHAMRIIEVMAIQQNRNWGTCSLNEFRQFLGLRPYSTFEEWNPRPDIADAARRLYHHPDNIELYVGLQAEESKVPGPGAGLCPGYTMSRAILADAVALVRGDRFFTNDFTAFNLTTWGINDCARNPDNSANGGVLCKLLLRHLPNNYSSDSSYAIFPMVTPKEMNALLLQKGLSQRYSFSLPTAQQPVHVISQYAAAMAALASPELVSDVPNDVLEVLPGRGYLATLDMSEEHLQDQNLIVQAFTKPSFVAEQVAYLEKLSDELIKERSYTLVGAKNRSVNLVREVLNMISVHFISAFVMGLPLKTTENPHGTILDQELYLKLRETHDYLFLQTDLDTKVARKPIVQGYCAGLANTVKAQFGALASESGPITTLVTEAYDILIKGATYTREWFQTLYASGKDPVELSNDAVALGIICSVELSQSLTHVVDAFLNPETLSTVLPFIQSTQPDDAEKLKVAIAKVLFTHPPVPGVYRRAEKNVGEYKAGDRIYISYMDAGAELNGEGQAAPPRQLIAGELVRLLGNDWVLTVMVPVIRTVFSLKDLTRAPGNSGKLLSMIQDVEGTKARMYLDYKQFPTPWSSDLTINYTEA
ncbi:hypothetical protein FRB97_009566 [Tulasnella sp. 331]|nr:hypothetical protein FRB97_009566 [Tulasnella sp. 331]